jgi:hypothetical protein
MSDLYERLLKQRVSSLAADFARLQAEQDEAIASRLSATDPEQRREYLERMFKAIGSARQVERRLHHAKRLLAHAQGDEYLFAVA